MNRPLLWKRIIQFFIAVVITVLLGYFLLQQVSATDMLKVFQSFSIWLILGGFVLYIGGYFFRAWRFKILLHHEVDFQKNFNMVCVHNLLSQLLPFRIGELSFVHLAKRQGVSGPKALSVLFIARLFDLFAISIIFFVSLALVTINPLLHATLIWISWGIVLLAVIAIMIIVWGKHAISFCRRLFERKKKSSLRVVFDKLEETATHLHHIKRPRHIAVTSVLSLLIWILNYFMYHLFFQGIGASISFWTIVLGISLTFFTIMLPINGIASFGTLEAAWSGFFILLGVSKEIAIPTAFTFHIITVIYIIILGAYGTLGFGKRLFRAYHKRR